MSLESNLMPPLIISPAKKRSLGFMKGPEHHCMSACDGPDTLSIAMGARSNLWPRMHACTMYVVAAGRRARGRAKVYLLQVKGRGNLQK